MMFLRFFRLPLLWVFVALPCLFALSSQVMAQDGAYRVEVLVFRHTDAIEEPVAVDRVRGFHDLLRLDEDLPGETPVASEFADGAFDSLWRRLSRLNGYEPLARHAWLQSEADYHPPVRVHGSEVIAEELRFPGAVIYVDLTRDDMMQDFVMPLYRLDGSVQLRRSRFLHIDLDLEYRIDDPAWSAAFPPIDFDDESFVETEPALDLFGQAPRAGDRDETVPEPFRIHRLKQGRQVRTGRVHYFDSPVLGALVRVTRTTLATGD